MWALRQCTMWAVRQVTEAHEIAIRISSLDLESESGRVRDSDSRSWAHHRRPHKSPRTPYTPKFSPTSAVDSSSCTAMIIDPSASMPN